MVEDAGVVLGAAENALRQVVESEMALAHGTNWLDSAGVGADRISVWEDRRREDVTRRGRYAANVEGILAYAEFRDLQRIIDANWPIFQEIFGNKARFTIDMERLAAFRNTLAHGRSLIPYETSLVVGTAGLIRNAVTVHMSKRAIGGKEHFPRFESVRDSFGHEGATGELWKTGVVLHPGDSVRFDCSWWDPDGQPCVTQWSVSDRGWEPFEDSFEWVVADDDIGENKQVHIQLISDRAYHRNKYNDDFVVFWYSVLPKS